MISRSHIRAAESLTHPNSFRPSPRVQDHMGSGASLYATHDQAILGHQVRLVDRVVEGSIDRLSFVRGAGHLESFESQRAEIRGNGGVTRAERSELVGEMKKLAGKMHAQPQNQTEPSGPVDRKALGRLFDELAQGVISKSDAVEELNWRCQQAYGEAASERPGPLYLDERAKVRASLVEGQNLHRPQWSSGTAVANQPAPLHPGTVALVRQALAIFPLLDQDNNGVVDRNEARAIITDYRALDLTASQAATLYSRQGLLAGVDSSGGANRELMAIEDLQGLLPEYAGLVDSGLVNHTMGLLSSRLTDQERRVMPRRMPLYLNGGDPDGSKLGQGLEGSCWFLGVLPTLGSEQLQQILRQEGDGFRMRFADGSSEFVTPLNPAERRVYSRGNGSWSGLMEKGVAQKLSRTGDDIKGGLAQDALKMLTGADCDVVFLNAGSTGGPDYRNKKNLGQLLQTTLEGGGALFTQVSSNDFDPEVSLVSEPRHAYTITGYDAESETVSLRNPWGHGEKADRDGDDDGNFTLSLSEMAATFSLVIAEKLS